MSSIQRPESDSPAPYIIEHGTEEEIRNLLQIPEMTNVVREHIGRVLFTKVLVMRGDLPTHQPRIDMLIRLASEYDFSVKLPASL